MTRYGAADDFSGAQFVDVNLAGAVFREADLSGVRMHGVLLIGADIDGAINGLRVNGVEVAPLIEAELDRLHPERTALRPSTPAGVREACATVESFWAATIERAARLPEADLHRSVGGEWSFLDTLRHLVFVTDAWFGHAVALQPRPFHPLGLPASFMTDVATFGIDESANPTRDEVLAARAERLATLRAYAETVTQAELDTPRQSDHPGFPPPTPRSPIDCLRVVFNEEWAHHQFAVRDLAVIEGG